MGKKETAEPQPPPRQLPVVFVVPVAQKENNSEIFQRYQIFLLPSEVVLGKLAIYICLCDISDAKQLTLYVLCL